jgi:uncharacterized membrane protein SirB2
MNSNIVLESIVVGLITLIFGKIVSKILMITNDKHNLVRKWSEPPLVSLILFMTGICIHLLFECVGFNKWYCDRETMTCVRRLSLLS